MMAPKTEDELAAELSQVIVGFAEREGLPTGILFGILELCKFGMLRHYFCRGNGRPDPESQDE